MGGAPRSADVGRAVGPDGRAKTALDRAFRPLTCDHYSSTAPDDGSTRRQGERCPDADRPSASNRMPSEVPRSRPSIPGRCPPVTTRKAASPPGGSCPQPGIGDECPSGGIRGPNRRIVKRMPADSGERWRRTAAAGRFRHAGWPGDPCSVSHVNEGFVREVHRVSIPPPQGSGPSAGRVESGSCPGNARSNVRLWPTVPPRGRPLPVSACPCRSSADSRLSLPKTVL